MDMHIKTYAITRRALARVTGHQGEVQPELPGHWYNWTIPLRQPLGDGQTELTRFMVVEDGRFDEGRRQWIEASNQFGLLPVLICSLEDGAAASQWPETHPLEFLLPIRGSRSVSDVDEGWPKREKKQRPIVAVLPLTVDDAEMCVAMANSLSMPEEPILNAWNEFCESTEDEPDEFCDIEASPEVWLAVAVGLQRWRVDPMVGPHLAALGYGPLRDLDPTIQLSWRDFAFKPGLHRGLNIEEQVRFIPLRLLPFCGIGVRDGLPRPFGLLRSEHSDGSWAFGDSLRRSLLELQLRSTTSEQILTATESISPPARHLSEERGRGAPGVRGEQWESDVRAWLSRHFAPRSSRLIDIGQRLHYFTYAGGEPLREQLFEFDETDWVKIKIEKEQLRLIPRRDHSSARRWLAILHEHGGDFEWLGEWPFGQTPVHYAASIPAGILVFLISDQSIKGT